MMLGHGLVATGALSSKVILIVVSSHAIGEAMAYQTNLIVAAAAGYRFKDFVRAGL
jgi:di/tricarboxylate transporter